MDSFDDLTPNAIELARQAQARGAGYIDLASSNPTAHGLLYPAELLRAAAEPYWQARRYAPDPHGAPAAREAIAAYYAGRAPALPLSPDDLFITASTSEAYSLLFALLAEPGDNVLGPQVTYPLFEYLAAYHHVELRAYRMDEARGWAIDEEDLRAQADERTRAVLLVSPHNPTGHVVQSALTALMELGVPVICDEVFAEFAYAVAGVPPLGVLMPDLPVFTLNGVSKMFALPDMKLGWIALTGPRAARDRFGPHLELLNDTFLGANSLTQAMLPALFAEGDAFRTGMRARVRANLDHGLARLGTSARVRVRPPEGGYYLFPEILDCADEEALVIDLIRRGVLVYPGYFYNVEEGAHLMLACLAEREIFAEGVERVMEGLRIA